MRAKRARALRRAVMAYEYDGLMEKIPAPRRTGRTLWLSDQRMRLYRVAKRMTSRGQL